MLEIKPNKELLKIKNTMYYGFSGKQFILLICGFICGVLIYSILSVHIIIRLLLMALIIGLFVFFGVFSLNGLNPGQLLKEMKETVRMNRKPLRLEENNRIRR